MESGKVVVSDEVGKSLWSLVFVFFVVDSMRMRVWVELLILPVRFRVFEESDALLILGPGRESSRVVNFLFWSFRQGPERGRCHFVMQSYLVSYIVLLGDLYFSS